jgi:diketogulonate reductase-like aldo/keto reductase
VPDQDGEAGLIKLIDGVEVPAFFYGTAWKEEKSQSLTELALHQGFRAIDTANQRKHYFESAVGIGIKNAMEATGLERTDLFLQTKFTYLRGQDDRLPYNPNSPIPVQVTQSFQSSLEHLQTDYVDSYVLHGPSSRVGLQPDDWHAWGTMEGIHRDGKTRFLGISNVSLDQLKALCEKAVVMPTFVQNRCYASKGWDRKVREFCAANKIVYQGFSLLTANRTILRHPKILEIGKRNRLSISQTVFRFAVDAGMIPLTGTSSADHMAHDLAVVDAKLSEEDIRAIENIAVLD